MTHDVPTSHKVVIVCLVNIPPATLRCKNFANQLTLESAKIEVGHSPAAVGNSDVVVIGVVIHPRGDQRHVWDGSQYYLARLGPIGKCVPVPFFDK